jgi:hypothetical protein
VKLVDLTGKVFGRLTVLERSFYKNGRVYWKCECSCGNIAHINGKDMKSGHTKSCGCLGRHGFSSHRFYHTWLGMMARCYREDDIKYKWYGGREIVVCDEWKDMKEFLKWCDGQKVPDGYTLDRSENNGNYCPENCIFVSKKQQSRNRRSNIVVNYEGKEYILIDFVERFGNADYGTVTSRIRNGWNPIDAVLTPPRRFVAKRPHV